MMVARSGLFVAPAAGPAGTAPLDARLALTGLMGQSSQTISGGTITQSAVSMQFTVSPSVWQINDPINIAASFLSATDQTVVTLAAGPATGSRIDLIAVKQNNIENGDTDSRANVYVVAGVAGAPGVAPATPTGAMRIATISVPASAGNAASCTVTTWAPTIIAPPVRIVQSYGALQATNTTYIAAGARATVVGDGINNGDYIFSAGGLWSQTLTGTLTIGSGLSFATGCSQIAGRQSVRAWFDRGVVYVEGAIAGSAGAGYVMFNLPSGYRPANTVQLFADSGAYIQILTTGDVNSTVTGSKTVGFSGFFHV